MSVDRRTLLGTAAALAIVPPAAAQTTPAAPALIDAQAAHEAMEAGTLTLVDVRTPGEWAATGIARGAVPISMRDPAFLDRLDAALGGDRTRRVGLICATGVRSTAVGAALARAGYDVTNVREGMMGSRDGPGWLRRGLPVTRP